MRANEAFIASKLFAIKSSAISNLGKSTSLPNLNCSILFTIKFVFSNASGRSLNKAAISAGDLK